MQFLKLILKVLTPILIGAPQVFACGSLTPRTFSVVPFGDKWEWGWRIAVHSVLYDEMPNGYVSTWVDHDGAATLISLYVGLKSADAEKVKAQTTVFYDALTTLNTTLADSMREELSNKTFRTLGRLRLEARHLQTEISKGEGTLTSAHLELFRRSLGQQLNELMLNNFFSYKVVTTYKNGRGAETRVVDLSSFDLAPEFKMGVEGHSARGCTDFTLK